MYHREKWCLVIGQHSSLLEPLKFLNVILILIILNVINALLANQFSDAGLTNPLTRNTKILLVLKLGLAEGIYAH